MKRCNALTIGAVTLVWALLASPVMAGQVANDITGMSVVPAGQETVSGSTYCSYNTSVDFTHKGPVHVTVYAQDAAGAGLSGENRDFAGSGSKTYQAVLWVPLGETATFGSSLGKHKGPSSFVVLDTFTATGTQPCS